MNTFLYLLQTAIISRMSYPVVGAVTIDPESLPASECEGLISMPRDVNCNEPLMHQITDCLASSLEYLGRPRDFENFRRTSRHFEQIYQRYKGYQSQRFHDLNLLFTDSERECKRYGSLEELLQTIPCIPSVYFDVTSSRSVEALARMQYRVNQDIVRGLTNGLTQRPFLSLSLWNRNQPLNALFVICVFDFDGLANVLLIKYYHHSKRQSMKLWGTTEMWSVRDLIDGLNSRRLECPDGTWRLEKIPKCKCILCRRDHNYCAVINLSGAQGQEHANEDAIFAANLAFIALFFGFIVTFLIMEIM